MGVSSRLVVFGVCWQLIAGCSALDDAADDDGMLVGETAVRCVHDHERVDAEIARVVSENNVESACLSDTGECQASPPCTGSVQDRKCDSSRFIGADAATCIAGGEGEPAGLHGSSAQLVYDLRSRRVVWNVSNTVTEGPTGSASGDDFVIDAVTGELLERLGWAQVP
jgi:hypothetical protein